MNIELPLPQDKKLTVVFRVEGGCLGPTGEELVDEFCDFAQKAAELIDADFMHWDISPRVSKDFPEMEYHLNNKKLSHDKAARYLELFEKSLDEFEDHFLEKIELLIETYHALKK